MLRLTLAGAVVVVVGVVATPAVATDRATDLSLRTAAVNTSQSGRPLLASKLNVVAATKRLGFRVWIHNNTARERRNVTVALSIPQGPKTRIYKSAIVKNVPPHRRSSVTFTDLGPVAFARHEKLQIQVRTKATTDVRVYPIVFTLP